MVLYKSNEEERMRERESEIDEAKEQCIRKRKRKWTKTTGPSDRSTKKKMDRNETHVYTLFVCVCVCARVNDIIFMMKIFIRFFFFSFLYINWIESKMNDRIDQILTNKFRPFSTRRRKWEMKKKIYWCFTHTHCLPLNKWR